MSDALHLEVAAASGAVIQQKHSGLAPCEKLFEVQNLPPVAQGRLGEHAHLGE